MEETIINGEALCASTEGVLVIEQYLQENYLFRRNVLNGKVEYATKNAEGVCSDWRPLTLEVATLDAGGPEQHRVASVA